MNLDSELLKQQISSHLRKEPTDGLERMFNQGIITAVNVIKIFEGAEEARKRLRKEKD